MNEQVLQRRQTYFQQALHLSAEECRAFLLSLSTKDRLAVEELLRHDAAAREEDFLAFPSQATHPSPGPLSEVATLSAGQRLGPYRLTEYLGAGGMGRVFRAVRVDGEHADVAIKIGHAAVQLQESSGRAALEHQALARLAHPNIVSLLDAGTTDDGRPYLVMDFIAGRKLTDYCDEQSLDVYDRLRTFATVCRAVGHAHENGLLHRDLKPSNILVTSAGEPIVIDFGVARYLRPDEEANRSWETSTGMVIGTPGFAAPEQQAGAPDAATPAADVFSLGATLYALVCGQPAFQGRSPLEITDQVRTTVPLRPRHVRLGLPQDVETICLTCLEKNPSARYRSAQQLASDIELFLAHQPILARPVGRLTRWRRWCVAEPLAASFAALLMLSVLVGLAATTVQWQRTRIERDRAVRNADLARSALVTVYLEYAEKFLADQPGRTEDHLDLLERLADSFERLSEDPAGTLNDSVLWASTLRRRSDVQFRVEGREGVRLALDRAIQILDNCRRSHPDDLSVLRELSKALSRRSILESAASDAEPWARQALDLAQQIDSLSDEPQDRSLLALSELSLAKVLIDEDKYSDASRLSQSALNTYLTLSRRFPDAHNHRLNAAMCQTVLATIALEHNDFSAAKFHYRDIVDTWDWMAIYEPDPPSLRRPLSSGARDLTIIALREGNLREADQWSKRHLEDMEKLAPHYPRDQLIAGALAGAYYNRGWAELANENPAEAEQYFRRSLDQLSDLLKKDPKGEGLGAGWMRAMVPLDAVRDDPEEAVRVARIRLLERKDQPFDHIGLGATLVRSGQFQEAIPHLSEGRTVQSAYFGHATLFLVIAWFGVDDPEEARKCWDEAEHWLRENKRENDVELSFLRKEAQAKLTKTFASDGQ